MWCGVCQADVAAEVSADNRRVRCATCGNDLSTSEIEGIEVKTKNAHELLRRWSSAEVLDPFGPTIATSPSSSSVEERKAKESLRPPDKGKPVVRVDHPHTETMTATASPLTSPDAQPDHGSAPQVSRMDRMHQLPTPHIDVQAMIAGEEKRQPNWQSLIGQIFAYFGVLGMFAGTVLVLMGYYGGPEKYAATGWLITTAGQMVMFLGVVTLVSGGMEQTTEEVSRKIDTLGNMLIRIEQASRRHALVGQHFPPEEYTEETVERPSA